MNDGQTIDERPPRFGKITGWHVLAALILFFGLVMVVNIVMIRAAVSTFGGVETRSSYKAGLEFTAEEQRVAEQDALGWEVDAHVAGDAAARTLTVKVFDRNQAALGSLEIAANFAHPVDERLDHQVTLHETGNGVYTAVFALPAGVRMLHLDLSSGGVLRFRSQNRMVLR